MKAILITRQQPSGPVSPQVEFVEDWPGPPEPAPGEIRVKAIASALNHMDLWTGMGIPGVPIEYPHIGGVDGCGVVDVVGEGVDDSWIGRTVVHNAAVEVHRDAQANALAPEYRLIGEHRRDPPGVLVRARGQRGRHR